MLDSKGKVNHFQSPGSSPVNSPKGNLESDYTIISNQTNISLDSLQQQQISNYDNQISEMDNSMSIDDSVIPMPQLRINDSPESKNTSDVRRSLLTTQQNQFKQNVQGSISPYGSSSRLTLPTPSPSPAPIPFEDRLSKALFEKSTIGEVGSKVKEFSQLSNLERQRYNNDNNIDHNGLVSMNIPSSLTNDESMNMLGSEGIPFQNLNNNQNLYSRSLPRDTNRNTDTLNDAIISSGFDINEFISNDDFSNASAEILSKSTPAEFSGFSSMNNRQNEINKFNPTLLPIGETSDYGRRTKSNNLSISTLISNKLESDSSLYDLISLNSPIIKNSFMLPGHCDSPKPVHSNPLSDMWTEDVSLGLENGQGSQDLPVTSSLFLDNDEKSDIQNVNSSISSSISRNNISDNIVTNKDNNDSILLSRIPSRQQYLMKKLSNYGNNENLSPNPMRMDSMDSEDDRFGPSLLDIVSPPQILGQSLPKSFHNSTNISSLYGMNGSLLRNTTFHRKRGISSPIYPTVVDEDRGDDASTDYDSSIYNEKQQGFGFDTSSISTPSIYDENYTRSRRATISMGVSHMISNNLRMPLSENNSMTSNTERSASLGDCSIKTDTSNRTDKSEGLDSKILLSPSKKMNDANDMGPPYPCPHCRKEFQKQYALRSHLISHSTERPFTCQECNKKFARKHDLHRHLKTLHKWAKGVAAIEKDGMVDPDAIKKEPNFFSNKFGDNIDSVNNKHYIL